MIERLEIQNYRCFERLSVSFADGLNILVGDNDVGKSTILEAIRLALTGRIGERWATNALTPYHFNATATKRYAEALRGSTHAVRPPELIVDVFLREDARTVLLKGKNNLLREDHCGLRLRASFDPEFQEEYKAYVSTHDQVSLVPVEYYRVDWLNFAGNAVTTRSVPLTVARVDATSIRLQSGVDYYLQQVIEERLTARERAEIARAYRSLRERFMTDASIRTINDALSATGSQLTSKALSLSVDVSHKAAWESGLVPHLDDMPMQLVGDGHQAMLKVVLALSRERDSAHVVLIEEPENHLSAPSLAGLVRRIAKHGDDQQVIVSTHSSFVLNKLGLDRLVLVGPSGVARFTGLPADTLVYFKRLSGYDTLRLVLARRAILVEGPSDELIVQRAYYDRNQCLPLDNGVEVINVRGLSHKRFLDVAAMTGTPVDIVTDLDARSPAEQAARFAEYTARRGVALRVGAEVDGTTLEPQFVSANSLDTLNSLLDQTFGSKDEAVDWMTARKADWALRAFEYRGELHYPGYINDAVAT